jgi:hypothetical protein
LIVIHAFRAWRPFLVSLPLSKIGEMAARLIPFDLEDFFDQYEYSRAF